MKQLEVETTQNVGIQFELASLGDRMAAYIIDGFIQGGIAIALMLLIFLVFDNLFFLSDSAIGFMVMIFFIPIFFYHLLFEIFKNGQTPGKSYKKIKVVSVNGDPVKVSSYFLRYLFRIIDMPLYGIVAMISISATEKKQRLGDIVAGTTVIRLDTPLTIEDTIAEKVKLADYQPSFMQAKNLSNQDIEIIKKVLRTQEYSQNEEVVSQLVEKIKGLMYVQSDMNDKEFLETVVKDYNYYHQI